jgi:flagellar hook protein FlgE
MPFSSGLSGLKASQVDLQVIGNNVANASTTGFKSSRAEFGDVYASTAFSSPNIQAGRGVEVTAVTQQFSQGQLDITDNALDLAVNGKGFFVLSKDGATTYTRAGAFGVDSSGYIVNANSKRLQGYQATSTGTITGVSGDLLVSTADQTPSASTTLGIKLNLNADLTPPTTAFTTGFSPTNPPSASSYNSSTSMEIFDSLGNSHTLTAYFVKSFGANTWQTYIGIDGADVTPSVATAPSTGTAYTAGTLAAPYTLAFSTAGAYQAYSATAMPIHYGSTAITSTAMSLATSGSLTTLDLGDLTLNGVKIRAGAASDDTSSTTDNAASAIAITAAINASSALHGVTATAGSTTFSLGLISGGATNTLAAGDLTINGVAITGSVDGASATALGDALVALIGTSVTGVTATNSSGTVTLTATDGRNIRAVSDGVNAGTLNLAGFAIDGGTALDKVQRGVVSLAPSSINEEGTIVVGGGANATALGFTDATKRGIVYTNSDTVTVSSWNPGGGAATQTLTLGFTGSSQYGADFAVSSLSNNGYTTGRLTSIDVDKSGLVKAKYSNGQSLNLGQVEIAKFQNEQGLKAEGQTEWSSTSASGDALIGTPNTSDYGLVQSGALENSNVALTDELVALIVAQRNFQANAQTIRTADTITQTIINIR